MNSLIKEHDDIMLGTYVIFILSYTMIIEFGIEYPINYSLIEKIVILKKIYTDYFPVETQNKISIKDINFDQIARYIDTCIHRGTIISDLVPSKLKSLYQKN